MRNLSKHLTLTAGLFIAAALSPLVASAQTTPETATAAVSPANTGLTTDYDRSEHHDYGWIGLAGLLGLAGLMGKNRADRVIDRTDTPRTNV